MTVESFIEGFSNIVEVPTTLLFIGVALLLTLRTRFIQLRAFPAFMRVLARGVSKKHQVEGDTINPFHALFAAMSTSIGMGSIVGPSLAITSGGPGALFWLVVYIFFGCVTKFVEVTFALHTRIRTKEGHIIGGPTQYLRLVSTFLARWYGTVMIFLFIGWSSLQANSLAEILVQENVPTWMTGLVLAAVVGLVIAGGAERVGKVASRLVPIMFFCYVGFSLYILLQDLGALWQAIILVVNHIFTPSAAIGGFFGATVFRAMREGIYKGVFISEAGTGTASIAHAMADTNDAISQGILAMFALAAETTLSIMSGLLILVTGVWLHGSISSVLMYEVFKLNAPTFGKLILVVSITLFVLTTVIGNTFNGSQSFASFFSARLTHYYCAFTALAIFWGAQSDISLVLVISEVLLALVAIPNLIGVAMLAIKKPEVIEYKG